eukprot:scaffold107777_cov37-Tisochrysis_lutea.AAC.2
MILAGWCQAIERRGSMTFEDRRRRSTLSSITSGKCFSAMSTCSMKTGMHDVTNVTWPWTKRDEAPTARSTPNATASGPIDNCRRCFTARNSSTSGRKGGK